MTFLLLMLAHSYHIGSLQQYSPISSYIEHPCLILFAFFEHTLCIHVQQTVARVVLSGSLPSMLDVLGWMPSITKLNKQINKKGYYLHLFSNIKYYPISKNSKLQKMLLCAPYSISISHVCLHPFK